MDIIDGELQRADQLREQLASKRQRSGSKTVSGEGGDEEAPLTGSLEKTHSKYQAVLDKQDQVTRGTIRPCLYSDFFWRCYCVFY